MDWNHVDYLWIIVIFLFTFTKEYPLVSMSCNAKFLQIWQNKLIYILDKWCLNKYIYFFGWYFNF